MRPETGEKSLGQGRKTVVKGGKFGVQGGHGRKWISVAGNWPLI